MEAREAVRLLRCYGTDALYCTLEDADAAMHDTTAVAAEEDEVTYAAELADNAWLETLAEAAKVSMEFGAEASGLIDN